MVASRKIAVWLATTCTLAVGPFAPCAAKASAKHPAQAPAKPTPVIVENIRAVPVEITGTAPATQPLAVYVVPSPGSATPNAPAAGSSEVGKAAAPSTEKECTINGDAHRKDPHRPECQPEPTSPDSPIGFIRAQITKTRNNVISLRYGLAKDIATQRGFQTLFDSTEIGLGIASAATAFARAASPVIGGLALAAGGTAQYRAYYNPEAKGAGLIKAIQATRCVATRAEMLNSANATAQYRAVKLLTNAIAVAEQASAAPTAATADPAAQDLQAKQQDATTLALTNAHKARAAINAELTAFALSPAVIDEAHDQINDYLDRLRHRSAAPDATAVAEVLAASVKTASDASVDVRVAREQLIAADKASAVAQAVSAATAKATAAEITATANGLVASAISAPPSENDTLSAANKPTTDPQTVITNVNALATAGHDGAAGARVVPSDPAVAQAAARLGVVQALNQATQDALDSLPALTYSTIDAAISACTAVVSS